MRSKRNKIRLSPIFAILSLMIWACGNNPVDPGGDISEYIRGLNYDSETLLNVQNTGGEPSQREAIAADTSVTQVGNNERTCYRTEYDLRKNFDKVAILRPTTGTIFPGALVKGNQSLMDGVPEPISIARNTVTMSIDLPGMGDNGIVRVSNPNNSSVQAGLDNALQWWNDNAYEEGYVNPASSSYSFSSAFSSTQLALDLDVNVQWGSNEVNSQFTYASTTTEHVVMSVYKQAFYNIVFDTPESPESVFADDVSLDEVRSIMNGDDAPAYVASVTYGRIIMFRMVVNTSYTTSTANVETALRYASGLSVDLDLESEYQRILRNSTIEVVTLGGNAQVASYAVSAQNAGDLLPIIQGENAVYSRTNPGVPIAYQVRYLKDNSLAKLGYTTNYTATECIDSQNRNTIKVTFDRFRVIRDCDGGTLGDGEFFMRAYLFNNSTEVGRQSVGSDSWDGSVSLGDADERAINREYIFTIDRSESSVFWTRFRCSEWDGNVFGTKYRDDDMNNVYVDTEHEYSSGGWTNTAGNTQGYITMTLGSGHCEVEFWYTVEILD